MNNTPPMLSDADTIHFQRILDAKHHDPFAFLGQHPHGKQFVTRVYHPHAKQVWIEQKSKWLEMSLCHEQGLFCLTHPKALNSPYKLKICLNDEAETTFEIYDSYSFHSSITADELYLLLKVVY